jgi:RimJ/RimL family protein N-acetyltransferase
METERLDGYERLVGRWDETRHQAALADGRHAYFVARAAVGPVGFVILRDWESPERVVCLKRIAVRRPGEGAGRRIAALAADAAFIETDAFRLWLGVFPENERARRAYHAAGFQPEGIARGSAFFGGEHRDELVMSLLRPEWHMRRRAPS